MAPLPDHILKFLEKPNVAVLATVGPSGRPQATPIWFLVEDGTILVNTSQGRVKLRNMQADPRVTLTVVDHENAYAYVQIFGRVMTFDRERGARDIDRLSWRYRGKPYSYPRADRPENRVTVLIKPERIVDNLR